MSHFSREAPKCIHCIYYKSRLQTHMSQTKKMGFAGYGEVVTRMPNLFNRQQTCQTSGQIRENDSICGRIFMKTVPKITTFYHPNTEVARQDPHLCGTHGRFYVHKHALKDCNISHMIG
jgi:hypothetical protein